MDNMYILCLNDMRASKIEYYDVICHGTKEELETFVAGEKVEHYRDGRWGTEFRQGGPLEWYNPADEDNPFGQGIVKVSLPPHVSTIIVLDADVRERDQRALEAG